MLLSFPSSSDDSAFGGRDERGYWRPFKRIEYPPFLVWPPRPLAFLVWFVRDFLFGWNLVFAVFAVLIWMFLTPSLDVTRELAPGWIAYLLARNAVLLLLWCGAWHLWLHVVRKQGKRFKYDPRWLASGNPNFLFRDQTRDNMFWNLASAVPIWTAFEVLMLWAYANGHLPMASWLDDPVYCGLLFLAVPFFREFHFYVTHRLLHWPPLYRAAHRVHHANVNTGPWSGLAMHPLEHLLYFSGCLIHFVVPSHPLHVLFQLHHAALGAQPGHSGFDKLVVDEAGGKCLVNLDYYAHILHHQYLECNYADGALPLDKWFGSFHDGTPEARAAMNRRLKMRHAGAGAAAS